MASSINFLKDISEIFEELLMLLQLEIQNQLLEILMQKFSMLFLSH